MDKSEDEETTTRHPLSPRLRRIQGRDEAADEERCREGRWHILVVRRTQGQGKRFKVNKVLIVMCSLAVLIVATFVAFVAGFELGHRWGYGEGWRDCKFDAKETLCSEGNDSFWKWHGSTNSVIRKRVSLFE